MREPPPGLAESEVLALVRTHWSSQVDRVECLPVGLDAQHWQALAGFRPLLFVTWDTFAARHTLASLEAAYASAAELAFGLDFVVAGLPSDSLTYCVPVAEGALSVTPWVNGGTDVVAADEADAAAERSHRVRMLARLHAAHPPARLRRWAPLVDADFADLLARRLVPDWTSGPHAGEARAALLAHAGDVRQWVDDYHRLAAAADTDRAWVVTHGEPHPGNQIVTPVRTLLVDWGSVQLAPRERDLHGLPDLADRDPEMVRLFDLERRLLEISRYAARFEAPHSRGTDDRIVLDRLLAELDRA